MSAFQDEIAGIFEDVRRYSMGDARIEECLEEAMKRITAEVDALVFEAAELHRDMTIVSDLKDDMAHWGRAK